MLQSPRVATGHLDGRPRQFLLWAWRLGSRHEHRSPVQGALGLEHHPLHFLVVIIIAAIAVNSKFVVGCVLRSSVVMIHLHLLLLLLIKVAIAHLQLFRGRVLLLAMT